MQATDDFASHQQLIDLMSGVSSKKEREVGLRGPDEMI